MSESIFLLCFYFCFCVWTWAWVNKSVCVQITVSCIQGAGRIQTLTRIFCLYIQCSGIKTYTYSHNKPLYTHRRYACLYCMHPFLRLRILARLIQNNNTSFVCSCSRSLMTSYKQQLLAKYLMEQTQSDREI